MSIKTILILGILVLGASQVAGFEALIEVSPQNGFNEISVEILYPTPPDPSIVGYAVVRYRHNECSVPSFISEVIDFSEPLEVTDFSPPDYCAYTYIVSLVNEAGEPVDKAGWLSIKTLGGLEHPIFRGELRSGGVFRQGKVWKCTDSCLSHPYLYGAGVSGPAPDAFIEARDTGQIFDVYGEISYYFEGPYFTRISEAIPTTCDAPLSSQVVTWSTLKSLYR